MTPGEVLRLVLLIVFCAFVMLAMNSGCFIRSCCVKREQAGARKVVVSSVSMIIILCMCVLSVGKGWQQVGMAAHLQ